MYIMKSDVTPKYYTWYSLGGSPNTAAPMAVLLGQKITIIGLRKSSSRKAVKIHYY